MAVDVVPHAVHEMLPSGAKLNVAPHGVWWWVQPNDDNDDYDD